MSKGAVIVEVSCGREVGLNRIAEGVIKSSIVIV